jgi:hypothetical protein
MALSPSKLIPSGCICQTASGANMLVLTLEGERVAAITQFLDPSILSRFELPLTLSGER